VVYIFSYVDKASTDVGITSSGELHKSGLGKWIIW